jgi:hypothetical protein
MKSSVSLILLVKYQSHILQTEKNVALEYFSFADVKNVNCIKDVMFLHAPHIFIYLSKRVQYSG